MITLAQLIIFFSYVFYIKGRFGTLSSISASTYSLQGQKRWWFLAFLWSMGLLNFGHDIGLFAFLASTGFFFTGITIDHAKPKSADKWVHTIATVTVIAMTLIGQWVHYGMWWHIPLFLIGSLALTKSKNTIWYIEILATIICAIGYLLN